MIAKQTQRRLIVRKLLAEWNKMKCETDTNSADCMRMRVLLAG
jgi:hypothetical protein